MNEKVVGNQTADKKEIMVLFSGGRDSILTVARLVAEGYKVHLITFDNGCIKNIAFRDHGALILTDYYNRDGEEKVIDHGTRDICGIWQMLMRGVFNKSFTELCGSYKAMSMSQVHCAICKTAMFVSVGLICQKMGIRKVASGDKKGDRFAVQHMPAQQIIEDIMKRQFSIEYLRPIWDLHDTFEVKSELTLRGLPSKTIEPQCVLGCPMDEDDVVSAANLADDDCAGMLSAILCPIIEQHKEPWRKVLG